MGNKNRLHRAVWLVAMLQHFVNIPYQRGYFPLLHKNALYIPRPQRMLEVKMALQTPLLHMMLERTWESIMIVSILAQCVWLTRDHFSLASWWTPSVFQSRYRRLQNLHEKALEIFAPTIRTRWNAQNEKLKDDLMNHMVSLLGETFNKKGVIATVGLNLKYVRENYRDNLQIDQKYERPPMVS